MIERNGWRKEPVAVLLSGGLDSAILLGELAKSSPRVVPIHIRFGLVWEAEEEANIRRFLTGLALPAVEELKVFEMPIRSVYGDHWSTTGKDTPGYESEDAAVFLPGRNPLLLVQTAVWCHLHGIPTIAMGPLAANPFPDSTDEFFNTFICGMNLALEGNLRVVRPYAHLTKVEVLRRGRDFPLELTMSCIRPRDGLHCGDCNKCKERQLAFEAAGLTDPTKYVEARG